MTSPTCLLEYDSILKIMPKLLARVTCVQCDTLLVTRADFLAGCHLDSCMVDKPTTSDDQALFDMYTDLEIKCPNSGCSHICQVSLLQSHLLKCSTVCKECGLHCGDHHSCLRDLKAILSKSSWHEIIKLSFPRQVYEDFRSTAAEN